MKLFLIALLTMKIGYASGAPCNGVPGKNHKNPDGSLGGFVAETANVSATAYVDATSSVCEKARVQGNAKLRSGTEASGSAMIEGNVSLTSSSIKGLAKIYGNAIVTNSKICQMSDVNFNVINSDYYCQTDDEEPRDPGELGKKTLLGIDSDVDGVRDDVEIWINTHTTNSPGKNKYNARMAMKQISANLQNSIKSKDISDLTRQARIEALYSFDCLESVVTSEQYEFFKSYLQVQTYNTMERLKAWARTEGSLKGLRTLAKRKSVCAFNIK